MGVTLAVYWAGGISGNPLLFRLITSLAYRLRRLSTERQIFLAFSPVFSRVEAYQSLNTEHSSGYPALRLALKAQRLDWLAYRLFGLEVKASVYGAAEPGFDSLRGDLFPGSSQTSGLTLSTPVATLLASWRYRLTAGNGWPGVSVP